MSFFLGSMKLVKIFKLLMFLYDFSKQQSDLEHSQNSKNRANQKSFGNANNKIPLSHRPAVPNQRQVLRRPFIQKDLQSHDGYSVSLFLLLWLIFVSLLFNLLTFMKH